MTAGFEEGHPAQLFWPFSAITRPAGMVVYLVSEGDVSDPLLIQAPIWVFVLTAIVAFLQGPLACSNKSDRPQCSQALERSQLCF
jgi:hypothetical protein